MAEEQQIRATHEEVEGFVSQLRDFHGSLSESEQAMLATILGAVQAADTTAHGMRVAPYLGEGPQGGQEDEEQQQVWNDLIGWIEQQGKEDTQGFAIRFKG